MMVEHEMATENVAAEGRIEAQIDFVFDMHLLIQELIENEGITRTELASRIGITKARLSQLMRPEANPTVRTVVDIFHALGAELSLSLKSKQQNHDDASVSDQPTEIYASGDEVLHALFTSRPIIRVVEMAGNENYPDLELAAA